MAIATGINDLNALRRHVAGGCIRYKKEDEKPLTRKPKPGAERKADTCKCPIWARGYLSKETELKNGTLKPKRVFVSLGTADWAEAETEIASLYKLGQLPASEPAIKPLDKSAITVVYTGERFLTSRKESQLDPIEKDTYDHYASLINQRWLPWCEKKGIVYIRAFEEADVCRQFTESWRQMRRNVGQPLSPATRRTEMQRWRTILKFALGNKWIAENGALAVKIKKVSNEAEIERFGLELSEYQQILDAAGSTDLSVQENEEALVATELMRWTGMRISDAHKFNASELVTNELGDGLNADFIQKKTKKRCVSPVPAHVVARLKALPGRMQGRTMYFFTCSYTALRGRVDVLATRAQKVNPFAHAFSPHCLRHTFAIQHFNIGTPIEFVSKWLGHDSVAVTIKHYRRWIKTTKAMSEDVSRTANARMMAASDALKTALSVN